MIPQPAPERSSEAIARVFLLLGAFVFLYSIALTIRTYMPCPFWDQWSELNVIAAGHISPAWLWSQHNEHRVLIPRLLMLLDLRFFGAKNLSLFVEIYLVQIAEWLALLLLLQRFSGMPRALRFSILGLFAFCIFHPNQAENFTWAFQISFVLPFTLGTLSLLAIAYFERSKHPWPLILTVSLAPLVAALNLSGGLLIGPAIIIFALFRRLSAHYIFLLAAVFSVSAALYLIDYHPPTDDPLFNALAHPKDIFVYLLTYLGASWTRIVPHKERITCLLSFAALGWFIVRAARDRSSTSPFTWFCIAECLFVVATALLTALARLQNGVGQAYGGRYQTPAMLYWASLGSLLLLTVWRTYRPRFLLAQIAIAFLMLCSTLTMGRIWTAVTQRGDSLSRACYSVMHGNQDRRAARLLYTMPREMPPDIAYLRRLWER